MVFCDPEEVLDLMGSSLRVDYGSIEVPEGLMIIVDENSQVDIPLSLAQRRETEHASSVGGLHPPGAREIPFIEIETHRGEAGDLPVHPEAVLVVDLVIHGRHVLHEVHGDQPAPPVVSGACSPSPPGIEWIVGFLYVDQNDVLLLVEDDAPVAIAYLSTHGCRRLMGVHGAVLAYRDHRDQGLYLFGVLQHLDVGADSRFAPSSLDVDPRKVFPLGEAVVELHAVIAGAESAVSIVEVTGEAAGPPRKIPVVLGELSGLPVHEVAEGHAHVFGVDEEECQDEITSDECEVLPLLEPEVVQTPGKAGELDVQEVQVAKGGLEVSPLDNPAALDEPGRGVLE